ncbi:PH domain-containing protein [Winogradskyella sp.]|uniref:PH domain-containing protein n=1 Tax=Winogradskyella sp. TaxID=1883156 RepID=UPI002633149E|nr:PH domain-containing protein [Winogradskyella sp.]
MSAFNFEIPSRQSAKGIIVIFGISVYKVVKATIVFIAAFVLKILSSDKPLNIGHPIVLLIIFSIPLVFIVIAVLRYLNFKFYVKGDYFFLRKGILNKEEISVSKDKIQNVYIKQNVLQQLINVVSLSIETAGDDKTEIEIVALVKPKAEALKTLLLAGVKPKNVNNQLDEKTETAIYFKASVKRLFLEGISENHFKSFVLIFAFIIGIYNDAKEFVSELEVTTGVKSWFALDNESLMAMLLFNLSILIILLVFSLLLSMIRMFVQNFNLTVKRKKEGLEISKGLLNKISLNLNASRIQNTMASTNKLKRSLGLYKLAFTQAMANKRQQLKFNIVALSQLQLNELILQFYPRVFDNLVKHKPHKYFLKRLIAVHAIIFIVFNCCFLVLPQWAFLMNVPLLIYMIYNIVYTYKKAYYHIDEDYIVVGSGMLIETHTSFLEVKKVQAVILQQTIFQKNHGVATLEICSASRPLKIKHIELNRALKIKNYLLYKVEYENKNWM